MADEVQKEISFPIIPEPIDEETREYLLRMQEIIREVSLGATYLSALTLQEFSSDGAGFLDEDDMASDSDKAASSQQGAKAYIDTLRTHVDANDAFSAYTNEDSNTDAMLKDHAYKAATDGYVSAYVTQTNNDEPIKGYVNTGGNPAGSEANLIKQSSDAGAGAIKSIGFWVAKDEYFEITQATDTPVIKWKSRGALSKPVDQD